MFSTSPLKGVGLARRVTPPTSPPTSILHLACSHSSPDGVLLELTARVLQVAGNGGPTRLTLDQKSPGSSPGGATQVRALPLEPGFIYPLLAVSIIRVWDLDLHPVLCDDCIRKHRPGLAKQRVSIC